MPTFSIPPIADIGTKIRQAFRAFLPGTDALIEPNNLSVTGKAFSLVLFEAYQRIAYLYRQLFASTADLFHLVNRHGAEYGLTLKAAKAASGTAVVAQVTPGAGTVPVGLQLLRDDGAVFVVNAATSAISGGFSLPVTCTTAGASTNTDAGTVLTVVQDPNVPNLAVTGTVGAGGLGGGADVETTESFRARVLQRKQATPMCGTNSDYERWALAVSGVTRAYASGFTNLPPGVVVYPLFDTTRPQGIPVQSDLDAVAADVETERPTAARVFYVAATPLQVDIVIGDVEFETEANQAAIASQLAALFALKAAVSTADNPLTFRKAWISGAIGRALGDTGYVLVAPPADIVVPIGSMPFLGQITYP